MASEFSPLLSEIRKLIKSSGPMPVWRYMELCLMHPEHGYYVSRDPLGREGDFWQPEYYDHLIRDGSEMAATIRYIQNNPIKAKLTNWRWFWPDVARVSDP